MPCSLAERFQSLGGTFLPDYTAPRVIRDSNFHIYHRENLKSYITCVDTYVLAGNPSNFEGYRHVVRHVSADIRNLFINAVPKA
jgi:hypothetical protein